MSIKYKMLIPMLFLTFLTAITLLTASVLFFSKYVGITAITDVETYQSVLQAQVQMRHDIATASSSLMASDPQIQAAMRSKDREVLISRAIEMQATTAVEFCTITDTSGMVIARSHEPEKFGDDVTSQKNIVEALTGKQFTGIEQGTAVKLSIRSGAPVYTDDGQFIGVVSSGFRLDQETFVDQMKKLFNSEVTVFLGDERISTTVIKDGSRAIGTKAEEKISTQVLSGNSYYGEAKVLEQSAFVGYSPITGADGDIIGMLFLGRYTNESSAAIREFALRGGLIAFVILLFAAPLIIMIARRVVAPVQVMLRAAEQMADGAIDVQVEVNTKDEMNDLAMSFSKMIDHMRNQANEIAQISSGDLSGTINVRSSKDDVGLALQTMINLNNQVFSEIIEAARQVSSGAIQVADGAQNLAQGSTEQASSIDALSSAIAEVYQKTQINTAGADEALSLINRVDTLMNESMQSMSQMLKSMRGISDASDNISRIIKVIDDIAFQTNILALNAAVEAARAGQHGKGFAVVADEVRNLAAKSAAAAKETSELIAGNVDRVQEGNRIVEKTEKSLQSVAECAQMNAKSIIKISQANREQEESLSQISQGIERISIVVQANTATAEQSAATSEEMSSLSNVLTELVSRFKLRKRTSNMGQFENFIDSSSANTPLYIE